MSKHYSLFSVALVVAIFSFSAKVAFAGAPLATDDAGVFDEGLIELEIGYEALKSDSDDLEHSIGFALLTGITERLDFGLAFPLSIEPESGTGAAEIGVKYLFCESQNFLPSFAVTFSNELGTADYSVNTVYSWEFGDFPFNVNFGFASTADPETDEVITFSSNFEFPLRSLVFGFEIAGETDLGNGETVVEVAIGVNFDIASDIGFFLGISAGLTDYADEFRIMSGFVFGF